MRLQDIIGETNFPMDLVKGVEKKINSKWEKLIIDVYSHLFEKEGIMDIQTHNTEEYSSMMLTLGNGDKIFSKILKNTVQGTVLINDDFKKNISGKEVINLPKTLKEFYREYVKN